MLRKKQDNNKNNNSFYIGRILKRAETFRAFFVGMYFNRIFVLVLFKILSRKAEGLARRSLGNHTSVKGANSNHVSGKISQRFAYW